MKKKYPDPKIDELIEKLKEHREKYHGFLMAVSRESDVNYNNLCSVLNGHRRMGYHNYFAIATVLPKVVKEFEKKDVAKKE